MVCGFSNMNLGIPIDKVSEVLLLDGWHKVQEKSFKVVSYEYTDGQRLIVGGKPFLQRAVLGVKRLANK
jgi:hypothetical protein